VSACYGNQVGCILRETANINDIDIRKKPQLEHLLLTRLHQRFQFPGRNDDVKPWKDDAMDKINNKAMGKFSNALDAWKVRVKRAIENNEPYSQILADNPTLTVPEYEKFKENCTAEETKLKSEKMKGLQERNTGNHRFGSHGYTGKRPIWAK
jgi:hypothetical protein